MSEESVYSFSLQSHLYLHPSENLTLSLIYPILISNNYYSRSRLVITTLSAKNKFEFINEIVVVAKVDHFYQPWKKCTNIVVSWLVHSMSLSIRQIILWMEKAE